MSCTVYYIKAKYNGPFMICLRDGIVFYVLPTHKVALIKKYAIKAIPFAGYRYTMM